MHQIMSQKTESTSLKDLALPKKGEPSICHPGKPTAARGLCWACYQRKYRVRKPPAYTLDYERVAALADITPKQAKAVLKAMLQAMTKALTAGGYVHVYRFGRLYSTSRYPRKTGNPHWGGTMTTYGRPKVRFKPSRHLRYLVSPQDFNDYSDT